VIITWRNKMKKNKQTKPKLWPQNRKLFLRELVKGPCCAAARCTRHEAHRDWQIIVGRSPQDGHVVNNHPKGMFIPSIGAVGPSKLKPFMTLSRWNKRKISGHYSWVSPPTNQLRSIRFYSGADALFFSTNYVLRPRNTALFFLCAAFCFADKSDCYAPDYLASPLMADGKAVATK
jgi:hypothetical protein